MFWNQITRRKMLQGSVTGTALTLSLPFLRMPETQQTLYAKSTEEAEELVTLPAIDFNAVAQRVVHSMVPQSGERALLLFDPSYYPQLAEEAERALRQAGVDPVVRLSFPPPAIPYPVGTAAIRASEANWDKMLGPLFKEIDLCLWLPGRNLAPDLRWERLLNASSARCIHCHFVLLPLSARSGADLTFLCKLYETAILNADYAAMGQRMDKIIGALRGQTMRITSPSGTDLQISVPATAWFHKSDGQIPKERAAHARSVRDREIEHPGGALRLIPESASARGVIVTRVGATGVLGDEVTMEVPNGVVVRAKAKKDDASFQKLWNSHGGDIDKIAEIVIGTHLCLPKTPSGVFDVFDRL